MPTGALIANLVSCELQTRAERTHGYRIGQNDTKWKYIYIPD